MPSLTEFVRRWLSDPATYDWSPYFRQIVCKLEGGSREDAARREVDLQKKVKAVISCDVTQEVFIEEGYEGPYDVVMCSLCLENVAKSAEEYQLYLERLLSLVGANGNFLLYEFTREKFCYGSYEFGGKVYKCFYVTGELICSTLQNAGFVDISIQHLEQAPHVLEEDKDVQEKVVSDAHVAGLTPSQGMFTLVQKSSSYIMYCIGYITQKSPIITTQLNFLSPFSYITVSYAAI